MTGCLSELALDDRQIHGRAAPAAEAHLEGCASCRARLAERAARVAEFEATLAAPTWTRIQAEVRARRRRAAPRFVLAALGTFAAAALWLVVAPGRHGPDAGPTPKGRALAEIACRRGDQAFLLGPGDEVAPGDDLRFRPLPIDPDARYIQVGSVDGTGGYVPFYPPDDGGVSVALPARGQPLDGSIRLDGAPGPERLFIVLSPAPLATRDVARAARAHAATGARVDRIGGAAVVSAWIVLPKRAGAPAAQP
jgi:hypothetical protein